MIYGSSTSIIRHNGKDSGVEKDFDEGETLFIVNFFHCYNLTRLSLVRLLFLQTTFI